MNHRTLKSLPKIELHCHLDGSISPLAFREIAADQHYPLPEKDEDLLRLIQAPENCESLADFLTCFDPVIDCLQIADAVEKAAFDVIRQAAEEAVAYIEIRYAPMLSTRKGLTCEEVVEAMLKGMARGEKLFGVKSNALLCGMRGHDMQQNKQVVLAAQKSFGKGVAGIDLAGNEAAYPPHEFQEMFELANRFDIPLTLHAGECGCARNIRDSVLFGAKRIGHGIAMKDSEEVLSFCRDRNIMIELCPTSNLLTKTINNWEDYPFMLFIEAGLKICISTDNRTVANTTLTDEFMKLHELYAIDYSLVKQLSLDAVAFAFTDDATKELLAQRIEKAYTLAESKS